MAVDWSMLERLRAEGAVKVTFHAGGELASVEFGPHASPADDTQHEASKDPPPKRRLSATGGLVPRAVGERS